MVPAAAQTPFPGTGSRMWRATAEATQHTEWSATFFNRSLSCSDRTGIVIKLFNNIFIFWIIMVPRSEVNRFLFYTIATDKMGYSLRNARLISGSGHWAMKCAHALGYSFKISAMLIIKRAHTASRFRLNSLIVKRTPGSSLGPKTP